MVAKHGLVTLPTLAKINQLDHFLTHHQMIPVHFHNITLELEVVAFSLQGGPDGMKLDKDRIRWTPMASQAGTHRVDVKGTDGVADATETVVIQVKPESKPRPKPKG